MRNQTVLKNNLRKKYLKLASNEFAGSALNNIMSVAWTRQLVGSALRQYYDNIIILIRDGPKILAFLMENVVHPFTAHNF